MIMFCNQCEQTAKGTGCTIRGVCGKLDIVAGAQDALVQSLRLLAAEILKSGKADQKADDLLLAGLFSTLTNVNFDPDRIRSQIDAAHREKARLAPGCEECAEGCELRYGRRDREAARHRPVSRQVC